MDEDDDDYVDSNINGYDYHDGDDAYYYDDTDGNIPNSH
jgi:hypothetical protein